MVYKLLPNALERLIEPDGRIGGIWYRFFRGTIDSANADLAATNQSIATINDTTDGLSAEIDTVQTAVAGVQAQWGVTVNINGRITGAIKLDSSATDSTLAVLADHFIIVHPSVNGTTIQAFEAGLVGGVATVGINGNLIVDGTILAQSLFVSQLSAINANLGTCTAGVIQSADGKFVIDLNAKTFTITT